MDGFEVASNVSPAGAPPAESPFSSVTSMMEDLASTEATLDFGTQIAQGEVLVGDENGGKEEDAAMDAAADASYVNTTGVGKKGHVFRDYRDANNKRIQAVQQHYRDMRRYQTVDYVRRMEAKWFTFDKAIMTVWEAFDKLADYVDGSDPDTALPNLEHMLQTAEAIRADGHPDWFQLVGLLHGAWLRWQLPFDGRVSHCSLCSSTSSFSYLPLPPLFLLAYLLRLVLRSSSLCRCVSCYRTLAATDLGKIMFLWGSPEDGQDGSGGPQWGMAGDTWVVGAALPATNVYPEYNVLSPDATHPVYGTAMGMYAESCGLDNLKFAFGHDEYMYRLLLHNKCKIPKPGLDVIRLHSCYPWHARGEYRQFMKEEDYVSLKWVQEFNKYDLYVSDLGSVAFDTPC